MKNSDKKLFWIGTLLLYIAMLILTVVPTFISDNISFIYINTVNYKKLAATFFMLALILYLMSKTTYKRQLFAIALAFGYFYAYMAFYAN